MGGVLLCSVACCGGLDLPKGFPKTVRFAERPYYRAGFWLLTTAAVSFRPRFVEVAFDVVAAVLQVLLDFVGVGFVADL